MYDVPQRLLLYWFWSHYKVISKKHHAWDSLTTELQVSRENKWHQFHMNTVGLDRKVEY